MKYLVVFLPLLASVQCHDITFGHRTDGRKVFDEKREASPAIWRQSDSITVNATSDEVISRVVITDLREDKDGDANIVDGGVGEKFVTIALKSPTALRGYSFQVEVYSGPDNKVGQTSTTNGHEKLKNNVPKSIGAHDENVKTEYPRPSRDLKREEKKSDTTTVNHDVRESSTRSGYDLPRSHQDVQKTTNLPTTISNNPHNNEAPKIISASTNEPITSTTKTTGSDAASVQTNSQSHIRSMREISTTTSENPTKSYFSHPRHQQELSRIDVTSKASTDTLQDKTSPAAPSLINDQVTSTSRTNNVDAITTQASKYDPTRHLREVETTSENHKVHQDNAQPNHLNQNLLPQKSGDSFTTSKYPQTTKSSNLPTHSQTDRGFTTEASSVKFESISHPRATRQENFGSLQTNQPKVETPGYSTTTQRNNAHNHPRALIQNESTSIEKHGIVPNIQQNSDSKTMNVTQSIPNTKDDKGNFSYHPRNLRYTDEIKFHEAKSKSDDSITVNNEPHTDPRAPSKTGEDTPKNVSNDFNNQRDHSSKPLISLQ